MKDSDFFLTSEINYDLIIDQNKILCEKCGGSGNLKTPENSRRTCLTCFGRGFRINH